MSTEHPWFAPGVALVLPERATLNTTLTTADADAEVAGVPVPENASKLVVSSAGDAPAVPYQIRTQRGGLVGIDGGATFVWRPESTGNWYGMEAPTSVHDARLLTGAYEASTVRAAAADMISLADGSCLASLYREVPVGPGAHRLETRRIDPDGTVTSAVVYSQETAGAEGRSALVQLQNGRILLFSAVEDSVAVTTQIRCDYSDDGGLTWALSSVACLREGLNNAGSDYRLQRLSAAAVDSTVCVLVYVVRSVGAVTSYQDVTIQYASRDDGATLTEVFRTNEASTVTGLAQMADAAVCATFAGLLCVVWVGEDGYPYRRILGSPYDPIDATPPDQVDGIVAAVATGSLLSDCAISVCSDDSGRLYCTVRATRSGEFPVRILTSADGGQAWAGAGVGFDGESLFWRGAAASYPVFVRIAPMAGRLLCLHGGPALGSFADWVGVISLGRLSSITLPPYYGASTRDQQIMWNRSWFQTEPEDWPDTTLLPAIPGGATAFGSGGMTLTTTADNRYWEEALDEDTEPNIYVKGLIRRYVVAVTSGGSLASDQIATRIVVQGGGDELDISLRHTGTGARLFDNANGLQVGSDVTGLTADTEYEWMIVTADGTVTTFYRPHTFSGEERWIAGPAGSAASASAAVNAVIRWGHIGVSTSVSRWRYNGTAYGQWVGQGYEFPYSNPRDLTGRSWPARAGVVTATGAAVRAYGLTVRGDSWVVSADSDLRLTNALVGGPRRAYVAPDDSEQVIVLDLASHDTIPGSDILVVSGFDSNTGAIKIEGLTNAGAATTLYDGVLTTGLDGLHFSCNGDRVLPATGSVGSNKPTFARHELTGSQWSHYSGGAWRSFVIRNNREGKWTNATTARAAILVDGSLPTAGSGTDGRIVPASWAVQISMRGVEYRRLRITIPAPNTTTIPAPAGGKWRIGRLHVGYAQPFMWPPSYGDRVQHEAIEETVESRDGQRIGLELAPTRRRITAGFVDGTSVFALLDGATAGRIDGDPPYYEVDNGYPVGLVGYELLTLEGVHRATRGAKEMVWLVNLQPSQTFVHNRRDNLALVYLDSDVARERFAGVNPMYGDALRGDVLELVEAT